MLVREVMTKDAVVAAPSDSVQDALGVMRNKGIRRLPVLDGRAKLVGIVSEKDLLYASPSPTTSLSVYELPYLLSRLTLDKIMTREVVSVSEDLPIEEAARIMADRKIGGLPVLRGQELAGIVTETDLFRALLGLLGGRRKGLRLAASIPAAPGTVAKITGAVAALGGDIVGLGLADPCGDGACWEIILKVQGCAKEALLGALRPLVTELSDIRET